MAEKPEVNSSQAIRDYFKANPTAKAKEVVDALAKKASGQYRPCQHRQVQAQQRQAARQQPRQAAMTSEAKTDGVNKTQAVRDYLKANKKAKRRSGRGFGEAGHHDHGRLRPHHQGQEKTRRKAVRPCRCRGRHRHPRSQGGPGFPQGNGERGGGEEGPCGG